MLDGLVLIIDALGQVKASRPTAPASVRPDSCPGVSPVQFARGVARDVTAS
jgi:hypothetical protein